MINKDEILPLLVEISPEFQTLIEDTFWVDDDGNITPYAALNGYARYLVDKLERDETSDFSAVFRLVERLHLEGDHYVQEAATVGLLEDIQNLMLRRHMDPDAFRAYLFPESLRSWDALNEFWHGDLVTYRKAVEKIVGDNRRDSQG